MFIHPLTTFRNLAVSLVIGAGFISSCLAQQGNQLSPPEQDVLKAYLQGYFTPPVTEPDKTIRYSYALTDLNDDAIQEVIIYIHGVSLCGSGGCRLLLLMRNGSFFTIITHETGARLPIRVLPRKNNGWHGISVWRQGGGNLSGNTDILSFDGKSYPSNPSTTPEQLTEEEIKEIPALPLKDYGDKLLY